MRTDEALACVTRKWGEYGACATCGWYGALYEYASLECALVINEAQRRIELYCLSDYEDSDLHCGALVPFDP
jgi:hypothetical protein